MKKFLKKRWHGMPIGIIAMLVLVGVVAAAGTYWAISGTVEVEVVEPLSAEYSVFGTWYDVPDEFEMVVGPYYAGESDIGCYRIYNAASVELPVKVWVSNVPAGWTITGDSVTHPNVGEWVWIGTAPAGGCVNFNLTLNVPANAEVGTYILNFRLGRES